MDIGDSGRQSDEHMYNCGHLSHAIENDLLKIPGRAELPNSETYLLYVFVADDAFGLNPHLMKSFSSEHLPHDQLVFTYRFLRVKRMIETSFGIAASRF